MFRLMIKFCLFVCLSICLYSNCLLLWICDTAFSVKFFQIKECFKCIGILSPCCHLQVVHLWGSPPDGQVMNGSFFCSSRSMDFLIHISVSFFGLFLHHVDLKKNWIIFISLLTCSSVGETSHLLSLDCRDQTWF